MTEYMREKRGTPEPAPDGMKRCNACKQIKPGTREFFEPNTECKYGVVSTCRECQAKAASNSRQASQRSMRQCSGCKEWKPATVGFFNRRKARKSGFQSTCRECGIKYKNEHSEERAQYAIIYSKTHKAERRMYYEHYKIARREHIREHAKRYHLKNRARINERARKYYQSHRAETYARTRNRRARKKVAPGTLTPSQIQAKLRAQRHRCYYAACGHAKFKKVKGKYIYHLEHTIPLSRTEEGPRHDINYVVLACPSCNLSKGSKLPHEFGEGGRLF